MRAAAIVAGALILIVLFAGFAWFMANDVGWREVGKAFSFAISLALAAFAGTFLLIYGIEGHL
ncbi:hypothetical protein [Speluncibacter jeojiensis]|uniref:Uncharacterized protein n=1 Tax=Speluncibacter jeojiensis TaxID=2710754 RepID=A0A9X4LYA2_9ACTN|nr:hypothetical protein [Corynebacteriales bacterium D3-21]